MGEIAIVVAAAVVALLVWQQLRRPAGNAQPAPRAEGTPSAEDRPGAGGLQWLGPFSDVGRAGVPVGVWVRGVVPGMSEPGRSP